MHAVSSLFTPSQPGFWEQPSALAPASLNRNTGTVVRFSTRRGANQAMELFGSSGYRAPVGRSFMEIAFQFGFAIGSQASSALIGTDTRTSSDAVKYCVIAGLLASGCKAYDAGVIPTPTLAFAARHFEAAVMVTASHNPPEYNGLKPWNPDGSAFDKHQRHRIEMLVSRSSAPLASWEDMEYLRTFADAVDEHIERILKDNPVKAALKVVVDCGGGAGCHITPLLLRRMGCSVIALRNEPTGFFPRSIEPTEENLEDLARAVRSEGADLGLAHDADADRLAVMDDAGRFVPGDKLLVMLARDSGVKDVATTVDASMALEELGFSTTRTRVGDAYVSEELKKKGGTFGGEPCGAFIFSKVSYCPDGIYAAARVVAMAARGRLSTKVDAIPCYPLRRGSVRAAAAALTLLEPELAQMEPLSTSRVDGLRLTFPDGWVLVRASGTEPKVRVTAEARTLDRANALYETAVAAISRVSAPKESS